MRNVLTYIAVALVAVMSAALIAPLLVDWSAHRADVEAQLHAITAADVSLNGSVEVRLLPTPYLALGAGSLSAPGADGPKLSFASARLELALVKLASGQIRFSDIRLEKPVLTIARGADGALELPALPRKGLHSTGFDSLAVRDGRIRIVSANGAALEIAGVAIDAVAPSLEGPARISGRFSGPDDAPVVFNLASEKAGPDGTPLRVQIDAGPRWPATEFDGALQGDAAAGLKALRLTGAATLTGTAPGEREPTPWRVAGEMTVDMDRAILRGAEFSLGAEERAIRADGEATLAFGSPARLNVMLKAKQANVDAFLRRNKEEGATPTRALAFLSRAVSAALQSQQGQMAIDAEVSAEPIILGAETLPDASAALTAAPGAPLHLRVNLGLPGHSRLQGEGDLATSATAQFRGNVDFTTEDFALLRKWASFGAPEAAAKAAAVGDAFAYRSAALSGALEASAAGFSGRNLKLTLDRTTLTGAIAFAGATGGEAARLSADLASDSLDVDSLPSLGADPRILSDLDLSLSLKAGSLHIARVGEAEIDSGSLTLKLTKTGPDVTLERLSVAGLDGASFDIRGAIGPDSTTATGHLRADRLHDFAALVSRLAPGDWSRILVDRAGELSPSSLTFDAHGAAEAGGAPAIDSLKATGSAGETQFTISLDRRAKESGRAVTMSFGSPNSGALLRQFGWRAPAGGGGRARVTLTGSGEWEKGYDVDAAASLAGSDLTWRGRFLAAAGADEARLFGAAKIKAPNIAPLLTVLGLAPANGPALGPADIGFDATLRGDRWAFTRLAASVAGVKATGSLGYRPAPALEAVAQAAAEISEAQAAVNAAAAPPQPLSPPPEAEIEGELTVDRMPLGGILALALGPPQPARAGAHWSDMKFGPPPLRPPSAEIKLRIETLDLTDGLPAQGFSTKLHFDRGRLELGDFSMQVAGGAASGRATLRRDSDTATLTGALTLDSVLVDRPSFSGRLGGTLDFASTGRSPVGLIDGLAGSGQATFAGAALAREDPDALDRVVAKAQAADAPLDETNIAYAFGNELGKGPLTIPDGSTPISLNAGVINIGPIVLARPRREARLSASLSLRNLAVATRLNVTSSAEGLKFWSGPPPSATVEVENASEWPKRQLDVSSLSASLAAQAIARETDRIAALEADIRERAFFNRRLKGERFMDRRRQEIEDWEVEQARLKGLSQHLEDEREEAAKAEAAGKAAQAAAEKAAADETAAEKAAAENAEAARAEPLDGGPAAAAKTPFAHAPAAPRSEELGVNGPPAPVPSPPVRPKTRPASPDPTQRGLY